MEHVKTEGLGAAGLDPDSTHPAADPRYLVLARFIRFCSTILSTPIPQEAAALIVNRIGEIVRVDRAVLVKLKGGNPIVSVTGGGPAAQDSSFADAIEIVRRRYREGLETTLVPKVPEGEKNAMSHLWRVQQALGGTQILWLPLWLSKDNDVPPEYALWLERWQGRQWDKADIELLQHSALFLGHGLARHRPQKRSASRFKRIAVCAILFILLLMPVNASITAPARVIPDRPHHIFAPMDGILKDLLVRPGQWVEKEALLFRYDARVLDKRLDEAYRNVAVAKAKLVRLEGAAHRDPDARAELPVQQLEVERAEADARFFLSQRERSEVRTIQPGVIVLDDPDALIGAVIQTGQAVLSVADPAQHKLHIMVPASDAGFLKNGAQVSIRLDSQPLKSYSALVTRVGFEIKLSPDQVPSVLTEAIWVNAPPDVRPGQKGTAKIYGPSTILGKQIFRKPLIAIRQMTGF
jgi:multidrug resistance efflux pump